MKKWFLFDSPAGIIRYSSCWTDALNKKSLSNFFTYDSSNISLQMQTTYIMKLLLCQSARQWQEIAQKTFKRLKTYSLLQRSDNGIKNK